MSYASVIDQFALPGVAQKGLAYLGEAHHLRVQVHTSRNIILGAFDVVAVLDDCASDDEIMDFPTRVICFLYRFNQACQGSKVQLAVANEYWIPTEIDFQQLKSQVTYSTGQTGKPRATLKVILSERA